jgi:hypothetical protein
MTAWHDYQERAADFFRTLGMDANVDERVEGARGQHDVDVVVRATRAGIEQVWVVECKLWRRSVSKVHVAALANIVQDLGADRGIMLSEAGFQAGAIRLASLSSNIALTSLAELNENAEAVDLPIRAATLTGAWALDALGQLCQSLSLSNSGHDEAPDLRALVRQLERAILDLEEPKNPVDLSRYHAPPLALAGAGFRCRPWRGRSQPLPQCPARRQSHDREVRTTQAFQHQPSARSVTPRT